MEDTLCLSNSFSYEGDLHNLKCFSLTSYNTALCYRQTVVLVHRMKHLEKLTLYLRIGFETRYVDGEDIYNDILVYMPQLRTFIFYISTDYISLTHSKPMDIQQTLTKIEYGQLNCIIDNYDTVRAICHIYSLPFTFTHLGKITNNFPNILFDTVTHLHAYDTIPMKHEFFMRISQAFPLLKSYSLIEYSHLISLDIMSVHMDYVVQFLLETKTHLPRLTKLAANYNQLKAVTMDFTRDATRHNCSNIKGVTVDRRVLPPKTSFQYFPLL